MTRSSILPLLFLASALAACSGADSMERGVSAEAAVADVEASAPQSLESTLNRSQAESAPASAGYGVDGTAGTAPAATPAAAAEQIVASDTVAYAAQEPGMVPGTAAVSLSPMLVRTGQAVLQVDTLEQGIARVRALAQRVGAVVGNTTISAGTQETRQAQMELRIPSASFDRAVGGLSPIGKVQSVNVTAEDVGEEYTDVSARVANARRLESRLLDLLERRSGRLEEILNLEREVARVRGEIEQMEGRLRYLRTRSSVSLLTITLREPQTVISGPPGERPIRDAFVTAWRSFVALVAGLIASLGVLIPLGFLAWAAWRAFRWMHRREQARDALYREALRRERERNPASAPHPEPEEPAMRP